MLSNNSKCDSSIESADLGPPQPCSVTDDCISIGDRLVVVSLLLPIYAVMYLTADWSSLITGFYSGIIIPAICTTLGLALGVIAQKKFKPLKYPTWHKVSIIVNAVCMFLVIIVSFFHLLY